jgi:hypothetical protein
MGQLELVSGGAGVHPLAPTRNASQAAVDSPPLTPVGAPSGVAAASGAAAAPAVAEGDAPDKIAVNFALTYGGVTSIETPVAVGGRYEGMALGGPAKAFDRLLDLWLTRALDLGMVGSKLGQLFPIHLQNAVEEKRVKANYLFLAGLGEPGRFASDDLQFVISNVVVAVKSLQASEFTCDLIGTRRDELTVEQAVRAFAQGIVDGYVRFCTILKGVTRNRTGFLGAVAQSLTIVLAEADRDKLDRIESALNEIKSEDAFPKLAITVSRRPDVALDSSPEANAIDTEPDVPVSLLRVTRIGATPDSPASGDITTLEFTALSDTASVPVRRASIITYFVRRIPERLIATSSAETREQLGLFFATCLIPDDFRRVTDGAHNLILEVDETTASYPWEMAAHRKYTRTTFLGATKGVSRQFRSTIAPAPSSPPPLNRELKVLVIADPAPGSFSLPGARDEGECVVRVMERVRSEWNGAFEIKVTARIGPQSENDPRVNTLLDELAKLPSVVSAKPCEPLELAVLLLTEQYDVIHFAGHGWFDNTSRRGGWIFSEKCHLSANEIFHVRKVPRLVFANACFSALVPESEKKGPDPDSDEQSQHFVGIAQALFARGIPNFIGAGWKVDDISARECASWFYARALGLKGPCLQSGLTGTAPPATIGEALRHARSQVLEKYPSSSSWGAYQQYGRVSDKLLPFANVKN